MTLKQIDKYIYENNIQESLYQCVRESRNHLGVLLSVINQNITMAEQFRKSIDLNKTDVEIQEIQENPGNDLQSLLTSPPEPVRVLICCSWTSPEELCKLWNKMSKGDCTWNNIQIVSSEPAEYFVIVNAPRDDVRIIPAKTILFRMEPYMERHPEIWGSWALPQDPLKFVGFHDKHFNNIEWHLSKTYTELSSEIIIKNEELSNVLSTVLSDKYHDPGHIKRIDFTKFLESKGVHVDVYGGNKFEWKNYRGALPPGEKDNALFPYKYTFNVENHSIPGYCTEKLIDGILSETLVFYHGCPNIREIIDDRSFVWLELSNFELDYQKIVSAIESRLWENRLPFIRACKHRILNDLQFFPRLEKIINS